MQKRKVVITETQPIDLLLYWQELAAEYDLDVTAPTSDSSQALEKLLEDAEALVVKSTVIDKHLLTKCPKLKMIQKMGLYPEKIDLKEAKKKGLTVATYSLPSSVAVSEHAMALILACAKKLVTAHDLTIKGAYRNLGIEPMITTQRSHYFQWMSIPGLQELDGMTLGIIGFGTIGQEIAKRAKAFNMNILYHKRFRLDEQMENDFGVTYVTKERLFKLSDFIVVVVPLTTETEKTVGEKEFNMMKPTAYFINVCRGGVVDEQALVDAIKHKKIYGAGLDVFLQEPIPFDHPYLSLENVTFTPHIAGGKGGGKERQTRSILQNISDFFSGKPIKQKVEM